MKQKILYIFTRTPLHVGAGADVGAIDQPVQRESHTAFPIIPASGQKGSFADQWPTPLRGRKSEIVRVVKENDVTAGKKGENGVEEIKVAAPETDEAKETVFLAHTSAWLFGSDTTDLPFAGALIFSEARILAFPIRSAKGSYAWITCPLMLQRAARDGVFGAPKLDQQGQEQNTIRKTALEITEPLDDKAIFQLRNESEENSGRLALDDRIVLEEYCFEHSDASYPQDLATFISKLIPDDELFSSAKERLVILSNGMMTYFATTACEVAQHVRISDETGTAEGGALFNQENVPSDTLLYSVIRASDSRVPNGALKAKSAEDALEEFGGKVDEMKVFQFGGDATTGLGFCSVSLKDEACSDVETNSSKGINGTSENS